MIPERGGLVITARVGDVVKITVGSEEILINVSMVKAGAARMRFIAARERVKIDRVEDARPKVPQPAWPDEWNDEC